MFLPSSRASKMMNTSSNKNCPAGSRAEKSTKISRKITNFYMGNVIEKMDECYGEVPKCGLCV